MTNNEVSGMVRADLVISRSKYPFTTMKVGGRAYQEHLLNGKKPAAIRGAIEKAKIAIKNHLGEDWVFTTRVTRNNDGSKTITVWRTQ